MTRALIAATVYFFGLFAIVFVLGAIRVLFIAPRLGKFAATFIEAPVMLIAAYCCCRWSLRCWNVSHSLHTRWAMVFWFLAMLFLFETLLGKMLFGRTLADQWSAYETPAGLLGLSAQLIAALLLLVVCYPLEPETLRR